MRPSILNPLFCDVAGIDGVGVQTLKRLKNLIGGTILARVLFHVPTDIRHRRVLKKASEASEGIYATFPVYITDQIVPASRRQPYKIKGSFDNTSVELVFFHYHKEYLQKRFPIGATVVVSGRVAYNKGGIQISHPDYCVSDVRFVPEFEPLYPLTAGVGLKTVHKIALSALDRLPDLPEWLDEAFLKQRGFLGFKESLSKLHAPQTVEDVVCFERCRRRIAYDELLAFQLALRLIRGTRQHQNVPVLVPTGALTQALEKQLPFELTSAQKRVVGEIRTDMTSGYRMTRLLQGDVGSGKTLVALMALLCVVESGAQGAFMAPTDILARQHFDTCLRYLKGVGVNVALLTGREKGKSRTQILNEVAQGKIQILIGTHALITEEVTFQNLRLVVIDEQHKFGVNQRLALSSKQAGVHVLSMTATPIPRTLALTSYGDMDLSILDEKPVGRQVVETRVMSCAKIPELVLKLKERLLSRERRQQIYWICPLVEESEKSDLMAAQKRFESLQKVFHEQVALVHGQMKGAEKDAVMERFVRGEIDVLVATTVIEVGVDVKTADVMVIEHAERFGLAGLHQLRGRIGRGTDKAICLLLHGNRLSETARKRLRVMRETTDGFIIAEEDLLLRGAGEILGAKQSGLPEFQVADLDKDRDLLFVANKDAGLIFNQDPTLGSKRGQALKNLLYLFQKDTGVRVLKAG